MRLHRHPSEGPLWDQANKRGAGLAPRVTSKGKQASAPTGTRTPIPGSEDQCLNPLGHRRMNAVDVTAVARGEGLEPSITGPEPVVLPFTPSPKDEPRQPKA